jgi:hypothetical protein
VLRVLSTHHPEWVLVRVDETGILKEPDTAEPQAPGKSHDLLVELFREACGDRVVKIAVEALPSRDVPAVLRVSQTAALEDDLRRVLLSEADGDSKWTLILNSQSEFVQQLERIASAEGSSEIARAMAVQVFDSTLIGSGILKGEGLRAALQRQRDFLSLVARLVDA